MAVFCSAGNMGGGEEGSSHLSTRYAKDVTVELARLVAFRCLKRWTVSPTTIIGAFHVYQYNPKAGAVTPTDMLHLQYYLVNLSLSFKSKYIKRFCVFEKLHLPTM